MLMNYPLPEIRILHSVGLERGWGDQGLGQIQMLNAGKKKKKT